MHELADSPAVDLVADDLHGDQRNRAMSAPGIFRLLHLKNEPVHGYAPGSPERAALQVKLAELESERIDLPLVIGGEEIRTGSAAEVVMPHRTSHVLGDVHQGGPTEVDKAIKAAGEGMARLVADALGGARGRPPARVRALAGPWRMTLNAATMLGQSKTAHQAEIDAACELIDFWRFNSTFMTRIYEEQPISSPGRWNRMEYRPLEGFVFAVTPFHRHRWEPADERGALWATRWCGNPPRQRRTPRISSCSSCARPGFPTASSTSSTAPVRVGEAALDSPDLAGIHFTGSTGVFQSMWKTVGNNIERYRNYPRIVGETGGKDFILAHPTADVDAVATAIVRGSFEYQGQKCSAASRVFVPAQVWPELKERLVEDVRALKMATSPTSRTSWER